MDKDQSEYEVTERERILNLSDKDIVLEYIDGMCMNELVAVAVEYFMDCDEVEELRQTLLDDI